jgi:hypothetical protein
MVEVVVMMALSSCLPHVNECVSTVRLPEPYSTITDDEKETQRTPIIDTMIFSAIS